jgi:SAM-dependent methyltransferase
MRRGLFRALIASQQGLSRGFDRLLPPHFRVDGNRDFVESFVPAILQSALRPGMTVYDVGGGKGPLIDPRTKSAWGLRVVGLDLSQEELDRAPGGAYDETICADVCEYRGRGDADLVICQALLEHVPDVEQALAGIASLLKPGGHALLFVPSRNALFARLNLLLPEHVKRRVLFTIFPEKEEKQGFPARYDRCTPRDLKAIAARCGLSPVGQRCYYLSSYFSFLFPLYLAWRMWVVLFYCIDRDQSAETFCLALRKGGEEPESDQ